MTISLLKFENAYPDEICVVCRDSLMEDEIWGHGVHRFHGRCIKEWVNIESTCPTCRTTVDAAALLAEKMLVRQTIEIEEPLYILREIEVEDPMFVPRMIINGCWVITAVSIVSFPLLNKGDRELTYALAIAMICSLGVIILIKKYILKDNNDG